MSCSTSSQMFRMFLALALLPALSLAGLYDASSPVLKLDASNYDQLILKSNYTSIVEFYAPWCGHCRNLASDYEKVAQKLAGLVKVAAVDCDDDANKAFCGRLGIQGFPTLRIAQPRSDSKGGKQVEDYKGPRKAPAMYNTLVAKIPNHVVRLKGSEVNQWLLTRNESAKAILVTDKVYTTSLFKALAIDFLGSVQFAQLLVKDKATGRTFGIEKTPTLLVLPGGNVEGEIYKGELNKADIKAFVSRFATPNVDPTVNSEIPRGNSKNQKQKTKTKSKKTKQTAPRQDNDSENGNGMNGNNERKEKISVPEGKSSKHAAELSTFLDAELLRSECLSAKSKSCLLLIPVEEASLNDSPGLEVFKKVTGKNSNLPMTLNSYIVSSGNPLARELRKKLELSNNELEALFINNKRGWWMRFPNKSEFTFTQVYEWIETIRLGDGEKHKLPQELLITDTNIQASKENDKEDGYKGNEQRRDKDGKQSKKGLNSSEENKLEREAKKVKDEL